MDYVSRITLAVNGQEIDDFKSVTENDVTIRRAVPVMYKTGFTGATPRYGLEILYVKPAGRAEFDFAGVSDGTVTVTYDDGSSVIFTGCATLGIGAATMDGDNEVTRTITMGAKGRIG